MVTLDEPIQSKRQGNSRNPFKLHETIMLKTRYAQLPSLVRTDESGDEGTMLERGLFGLGTGRGFRAGGARAGSIFQGDTLSGRGVVEVSSHLT